MLVFVYSGTPTAVHVLNLEYTVYHRRRSTDRNKKLTDVSILSDKSSGQKSDGQSCGDKLCVN